MEMTSIICDRLRDTFTLLGTHRKGDKKRLGFLFGYILITTTPITMMLMATERGKDWVFLGIGVRIYKMELDFIGRFKVAGTVLAVT